MSTGKSSLALSAGPSADSAGPKSATAAPATPTTRPKRSLSNSFLKIFGCLSTKPNAKLTGSGNNAARPDTQGMSAGVRAQMAAQTVGTHKKQASTSTQTSTPVIAQKEKGALAKLDSTQPPSKQKEVSTVTLSPAPPSDVPSTIPDKVSHEYHTLPIDATVPRTEDFDAAPLAQSNPSEPLTLPIDNDNDSNDEDDKNSSSIEDGEHIDAPSESQQIAMQEAEQHDYENPVALAPPDDPMQDMYDEQGFPLSSLSPSSGLLAPISKDLEGRKCLILDLDETLVHSSFRYIRRADFVIPVKIDSQFHNVYVIKRPGVDEFMRRVGELYEVVVFTASVSKYGDPLLDQLDVHNVVHHRLFRESCYNHHGNFVKNLAVLGRPLQDVIIIDNSPTSYIFHPQHAIPVSSWFSDAHDNELLDMIPFLEDLATNKVPDVSMVLDVNLG